MWRGQKKGRPEARRGWERFGIFVVEIGLGVWRYSVSTLEEEDESVAGFGTGLSHVNHFRKVAFRDDIPEICGTV